MWRCVYRASYCNVLMTNEMHKFLLSVFLFQFFSALHVSNESSRSSSGARHKLLYYAVVPNCVIQYIMPCSWWWTTRFVRKHVEQTKNCGIKTDYKNLCISLVINTLTFLLYFWRDFCLRHFFTSINRVGTSRVYVRFACSKACSYIFKWNVCYWLIQTELVTCWQILVKTWKYKILLQSYSTALKLLCRHATRHMSKM